MRPAPERERRPAGNGTALENESISSNENSLGRAGDQGPLVGPALIKKNQRETLRLAIDEYKGHILLSARLWYEPKEGGELRPGRDGWAIDIAKLPEIVAELARLEVETRSAGLLK